MKCQRLRPREKEQIMVVRICGQLEQVFGKLGGWLRAFARWRVIDGAPATAFPNKAITTARWTSMAHRR